jgi:hypothetical protein
MRIISQLHAVHIFRADFSKIHFNLTYPSFNVHFLKLQDLCQLGPRNYSESLKFQCFTESVCFLAVKCHSVEQSHDASGLLVFLHFNTDPFCC